MKAIIMAAGRGKRLDGTGEAAPKALRELAGRPLIAHVAHSLGFLPQNDICVIIGYKGEMVRDALGEGYAYAWQREQLGTGHAVLCAEEFAVGYDGPVLVASGDMPLVRRETYRALCEEHIQSGAVCTVMTVISDAQPSLGRIIREEGNVTDIVEAKDATPEQYKINELNLGAYVFDSAALFRALRNVRNENAQGEYYLTDVPKLMLSEGFKIAAYTIADPDEGMGINTPEDLAKCERLLSK